MSEVKQVGWLNSLGWPAPPVRASHRIELPFFSSEALLFGFALICFYNTVRYEFKEAVEFSKLNSQRVKFCCPKLSADTACDH